MMRAILVASLVLIPRPAGSVLIEGETESLNSELVEVEEVGSSKRGIAGTGMTGKVEIVRRGLSTEQSNSLIVQSAVSGLSQ